MESEMELLLKSLLKFRKPGLVLFGHGVTRHKNDPFIENLHLDFNEFKATVEWYQRLGFHFISMDTLIKIAKKNFKYRAPWIHLTFDDGYRNNFTLLHPFLQEIKIPWSLFVSTKHIEQNQRFYTYRIRCALMKTRRAVNFPEYQLRLPARAELHRRVEFINKAASVFKTLGKQEAREFMQQIDSLLSPNDWERFNQRHAADEVMSVAELKELASLNSVHVGSHCHDHLVLNDNLSAAEVADEMERSRNWIQSTLKRQNLTFGYPNGKETDLSDLTRRICQQSGYRLAFTTQYQSVRPDTDPFQIPRISFPETLEFARHQLLSFLVPRWMKQIRQVLMKP